MHKLNFLTGVAAGASAAAFLAGYALGAFNGAETFVGVAADAIVIIAIYKGKP